MAATSEKGKEPAAPRTAPAEATEEAMSSARIASLERQLSELSRERREEASRAAAEVADLKAKLAGGSTGAGGVRTSGPGLAAPMDVTYYLQKRKDRIGQTGGRVQVWDTLPSTGSREPYRVVPDWLSYTHGAGSYRTVDGYGNQTGSIMQVQGDDPDVIVSAPPGSPAMPLPPGPLAPSPMQPMPQPGLGGMVYTTPAGHQVVVPSAMDRAMQLYDAAMQRKDPTLQQLALQGIGKAIDSGGSGGSGDAFDRALAEIRRKNEMEAEVRKSFGLPPANPMMGGVAGAPITINAGGQPVAGQPMTWPTDPNAQVSMVELMAQREANAATAQMYGTLATQIGNVLERVAGRLAPPQADAGAVASAGARLAGMAPAGGVPQLPGATGAPAMTTYAPPASGQRPAAAQPPPAMQPPRGPPPQRAPPAPMQPEPVPSGGGPRVPNRGGPTPQAGNPNTFTRCADCLEDFTLAEYLEHLNASQCAGAPGYQPRPGGPPARAPGTKAPMPGMSPPKGKPAAPAAAPAAPAPAAVPTLPAPTAPPTLPATTPPPETPVAAPGGTTTPATASTYQGLPEGLRRYLGYMSSLTGYIQSFGKGNAEHAPESIANTVWMLAPELDKAALSELLVDGGFDKVLGMAKPFIEGLQRYPTSLSTDPAKREEEFTVLVDALSAAKLIDPATLKDVADINHPVELLKGHIAIQTEGDGRVWICRFLNQLARKAEKPLPHPEVLPKETESDTL